MRAAERRRDDRRSGRGPDVGKRLALGDEMARAVQQANHRLVGRGDLDQLVDAHELEVTAARGAHNAAVLVEPRSHLRNRPARLAAARRRQTAVDLDRARKVAGDARDDLG